MTMREDQLPLSYVAVRMWRQGDRYKFSGSDPDLVDRVWTAYMRSQSIRLEIRAWEKASGFKTDVFDEWVQELECMVRLFTQHVWMDHSVVDDGGDPLSKATHALASLGRLPSNVPFISLHLFCRV